MQKKPFDPDSFVEELSKDEGLYNVGTTGMKTSYGRWQRFNKKVRPCHKCGSTTYTRLRYDRNAVGFRRDSAIGCSKCVK